MKEIVRAIAANEERLLTRLRQLVEIESPSEDKAAVDKAGKAVEEWLRQPGYKLTRHRAAQFGDVLEFKSQPSKRGRVLLLGHLDTVWPLGTLAKMPWHKSGGKLFGPGVLDMKAGVVMAIEALSALQSLSLERPFTLLLNSEEEVGSPVSRPITERVAQACDAVFVLEPAQDLAYKTSRKGVGNFHLHVQGVASHAGVDFASGHSAILQITKFVERISALTHPARGTTVNVGVISGGTRSNVVPAEAFAEVDVRIVKASDASRIERFFKTLKTTDPFCKLTVSGGINRPPMERKQGTIALFRRAQKLAREIGFELEEASTGGGSDGNFTAAMGVPTLDGMGAVGDGAHADHEHIVAKHLVERTALLAGMIASV